MRKHNYLRYRRLAAVIKEYLRIIIMILVIIMIIQKI